MALLHTVTNSTFTEWSTILAVLLAAIFLDSGGAAAWASVAIALLAGGLGGIWRTAVQVPARRPVTYWWG